MLASDLPCLQPPIHPHDAFLDARGLACPLPLLKTKQQLHQLADGQTLWIAASDSGAWEDIASYARLSGHQLVWREECQGCYQFLLTKKT